MRKKFIISLALLIFLLGNAPHAGAFFLENFLTDLIKPFTPVPDTSFSLDSNIELVEDLNNNNEADGGDILRFSYKINNPTKNAISFATLKTNIPKKYLNFIHNIRGTVNLSDKDNTITIPNLRINSGEDVLVSFDARVNFFSDADKTIFTEPEIITSDQKAFIKSGRKELKAKAWKGKVQPNVVKREAVKK